MADEIARELKLKIVGPLLPDIEAVLGHHLTGSSAVSHESTEATPPPQSTTMKPVFVPPRTANQPFILHEEQSPPAGGERTRPKEEGLVRPTFYEPEIGSMKYEERNINEPTVARLEIGGLEEQKKKPRVGKTEEPKMRVVHYSGPQTPVDPFAPQQEIASPPPTEIHPENIVDLKDLPK
ncbi:MAG: hypothetical protein HYY99_01405 [Candidatus Colwellbacteria bacterium]|nr:hypothetical protein [Candidatus Colwellbacteria bacterium]